jgi:hypothetical protein
MEGKETNASSTDVMNWGADVGFNFTANARLYDFIKKYIDGKPKE